MSSEGIARVRDANSSGKEEGRRKSDVTEERLEMMDNYLISN
jgi:hypothetical protein